MSLSSSSSYLTCNLVPRRGVDPYDGPQPQTATCCSGGFSPDGLAQPRYAPLRTPASAALLQADDEQPQPATKGLGGGGIIDGNKSTTTTPTKKTTTLIQKVVRKCKSTVEDVDVSKLIEGPRLRRSGAVRRDWSFENLRASGNNNNNAA